MSLGAKQMLKFAMSEEIDGNPAWMIATCGEGLMKT
jgi:hypothetical protein